PLAAKNGIIDIAKKTGIPVLPMTAIADRYFELRSWDRLRIPKPFARVVVAYAPPFLVPSGADGAAFEEKRAALDVSLTRLDATTEQNIRSAYADGGRIKELLRS